MVSELYSLHAVFKHGHDVIPSTYNIHIEDFIRQIEFEG